MKAMRTVLIVTALLLALLACSQDQDQSTQGATPAPAGGVQAKDYVVTIGTAGITSDTYAIGQAIAQMVNAHGDANHVRCIVAATGGSIFNINALMTGDLQFGLVQTDRQDQAIKGRAEWRNKGPQSNLRAVFNIPTNSLTLVTSAQVPDAVVYVVAKEVLKNIDEFKRLHPTLAALSTASMRQGLAAPIHPGAKKFYDSEYGAEK